MRALLLAMLLLMFSEAADSADLNTADLKRQIDAGNAAWVAGVTKHDAHGLAALYTEDATMLPPDADILKGRAAIQKYIQDGFEAGFSDLVLKTVDLTRMGPTIAREIGRYSYDLQNSQKQLEKVEGKYVVLWRLVGGKWMLDTDIWNVSK
jgi:uncharacterized protein (TIGR02246 family)